MARRTVQDVIDEQIQRAFIAGMDHFAIWGAGIDSAKAGRAVEGALKRGSGSTLRLIQREAREAIIQALLQALLQAAHEAATPGPWAWQMSKDGRILDLLDGEKGGGGE